MLFKVRWGLSPSARLALGWTRCSFLSVKRASANTVKTMRVPWLNCRPRRWLSLNKAMNQGLGSSWSSSASAFPHSFAKGCALKPTAQPTALEETHPPTHSFDPTDAARAVALASPDARARALPRERCPSSPPRAHQPTPAPTYDPTRMHFKKPSSALTNSPGRLPTLKPEARRADPRADARPDAPSDTHAHRCVQFRAHA